MTTDTLDRLAVLPPRAANPAEPGHGPFSAAPAGVRHRRTAGRGRSVVRRRGSGVADSGRTAGVARHASRVGVGAGTVLTRVGGMIATAAALTYALAGDAPGPERVVDLASASVPGVAASTVLCVAWGFQDRRARGLAHSVRCWVAVAITVGAAHGAWFAATAPGGWAPRLGTAGATLVIDALLVGLLALLGIRAADSSVAGAESTAGERAHGHAADALLPSLPS